MASRPTQSPSPLRHLPPWTYRRIPLALLLGLITTIAVSWTLVVLGGSPQYRSINPPRNAPDWPNNWPKPDDVRVARRIGCWETRWVSTRFPGDGSCDTFDDCQRSFGWPLPALATHVRIEIHRPPASAPSTSRYVNSDSAWSRGLPITSRTLGLANWNRLPIQPRILGLTLDTALFSAAWWFLLCAPRLFLHHRRTRDSRCPHCGYDLRGQPTSGCSECGWNRRDAATA